MGEAKIVGDDIIFHITPSLGASVCLKNAMRDTQTVLTFLDGEYEFDKAAFHADTIDNFPSAHTIDESTEANAVDDIPAADD